jgi:hypothetical protein
MDNIREAIESARELLSQHYENAEDTTTKQICELAIDRMNIALKEIENGQACL